jgi:CBS domain containing-hemolysin-like protein
MTALKILAVFLLVFANGFFVAAEFSLVSVRRTRIETLAAGGSRRAKQLLGLIDNVNEYISATQLGITLASLALGWIGEPTVAALLAHPLDGVVSEWWLHTISFFVGFAVITFFHIVIGELVPKRLALESSEKVSLATGWLLHSFYKIFYYPIRFLFWAGNLASSALGLQSKDEHGSIYTEDELRQLINASHQSGHLEKEEQQLINRVFDFSEAEVREAMIPRTAVAAIPVTATLAEVEESFCESGYSRLPVYRDQLDNIVGVLFMKDIMPCLKTSGRKEFDMETMVHPPMFVPATARLGNVLAQMQSARTHLAFAIDEHGGIEGILTLEDLLEEIVGEINDEYDEEVRAQIVEENGAYLLDGMLAVRDANRKFKLKLPEDAGYTTLAGFLLARAGRILKPGETVEHDGASFTVERVDRHRIRRVRFTPAPPPPSEEAEDTAA